VQQESDTRNGNCDNTDSSEFRLAYIELASLSTTPYWARVHIRTVLRAWQMHAETIETAELLVSELVTNATKFSAQAPVSLKNPDPDPISLTLRLQRDRLVIEVGDSDMSPPTLTEAGPDAESGRGLMLLRALSKEWNYFFPASGGKTVYCVICTGS
jgi:anti-sigma regulatory factor (Ser/Thr protein kinase)